MSVVDDGIAWHGKGEVVMVHGLVVLSGDAVYGQADVG